MTVRLPSASAAAMSGARSSEPAPDGAADAGRAAEADGPDDASTGAGLVVLPQPAAPMASVTSSVARRRVVVAVAGIRAPASRGAGGRGRRSHDRAARDPRPS